MRRPLVSSILVSTLACLLAVSAASAGDQLDVLRASGAVGERYDGYAVVRAKPTDPSMAALVESVNAKRRAIYEERAKKQGVPVQEVGKVYAQEIAPKTPSGTWLLGEDGKWTQKK